MTIGIGLIETAGLCAACLLIGWVGGCTEERHDQELKAEAAEGAAMAREKGLRDEWNQIRRSKDGALLRLADQHQRDLDGLRERAARLSRPEQLAACRGATGAELSRPDAGFLVGEAARADRILAERDEARQQLRALIRACGG